MGTILQANGFFFHVIFCLFFEFLCLRFPAAWNQANGVKERDQTDRKRADGVAGSHAISADPT